MLTNICEGDASFRFGGTAADLLFFQPGVRGLDRRGGEGEVGSGEVEGEGGVGGGSKSLVDGAEGLRLEEGGEGERHPESVEVMQVMQVIQDRIYTEKVTISSCAIWWPNL